MFQILPTLLGGLGCPPVKRSSIPRAVILSNTTLRGASSRTTLHEMLTGYTHFMRTFSLLFAFIALVLLAQFLIYVIRGPVDPFIAGAIFFSFLVCLVPALYLLKPFEGREELRRRRERSRKEREERRGTDDPTGGPGS
jgi:hypothetical protein